jgi:glucose/mannose-6-phosphate isomerase
VRAVADEGRPRAVVVAALGGSAVAADLLDTLAGPGSPTPVIGISSGTLPGWVGPVDLVVAVSLSGRAAGPLAVAAEAGRRGCRLLTIGAPGSPLADVCARARGVHVAVSSSLRSSRSSLWSLAVPLLLAGAALDLVDVTPEVLEETATILDEVAEQARPSSESFVNPAKGLALSLAGNIPLVLAEGDCMGVAARRAVGAFARNARHPAVSGVLPDAAATIVAMFDGPFAGKSDDIFADPFEDGAAGTRLRLVMLRDPGVVEHVARVADAVAASAADAGVGVDVLEARGRAPLARLAGQIAMTDFASAYLALGAGLDPATSHHVADLREETA